MKIIVGVDKGSYTNTNNVITVTGVAFTLESLLIITNVDTGELVYNFASTATTATVSGSTITISNEVAIPSSSNLQIMLEDSEPLVTSTSLVPELHNEIAISYSANIKTLVYKKDSIPVATLTVTEDGNGNVTSIVRS
ncbi:hypothetical protein H8D85_01750 [bacterium]|nr:hypothetical protein [bacterium]